MKVCRTLPQDLEDEAIASYDMQGDQLLCTSGRLLAAGEACKKEGRMPPSGIDNEFLREEWDTMFWYVFGYAIAKGWKRKGPFAP